MRRSSAGNIGPGLLPNFVDVKSGRLSGEVSFGGGGDSYYEYIIKGWVQGRCTEDKLLENYKDVVSSLTAKLIHTTHDGLKWIGTSQVPSYKTQIVS